MSSRSTALTSVVEGGGVGSVAEVEGGLGVEAKLEGGVEAEAERGMEAEAEGGVEAGRDDILGEKQGRRGFSGMEDQ